MKTKALFSAFSLIGFWLPIAFLSVLLSHNAILYFTHGGEYGILPEKISARQDISWNIAFYTHLPTGIICLLTPLFLFGFRYLRYPISWHRTVGKMYVWITLLIVSPTGMYLALYAKGGLITTIGFVLQGILLSYFTWRGYIAIQNHDRSGHLSYMIRSYAVAIVVLSFRVYHILFFFLKVPYADNYAISQWLGLSGNLLIAEIIICFLITRNPITLKIKYI